MSVTAHYALKAIVRGLAKSGALNIGQMHAIFHELEDAADQPDNRGRASDAAELREIIEATFEDGKPKVD